MKILTRRIGRGDIGDPVPSEPVGEVALPFEKRQRSRQRIVLGTGAQAGTAFGVELPRGTVLRDGDLIATADGTTVRVIAAPESLLQADAADASQLARLAYHLGNRHVSLQIGPGWLRLQADHVLGQMVEGLGARVVAVEAPFEPESGAYSHEVGGAGGHGHAHGHHHHHHHGHDDPSDGHRHPGPDERADAVPDRRHQPRIHDLLADRKGRDAA
ncbi:MAG: urease accessory protein UreE [Burkholderiaceae bacterium]